MTTSILSLAATEHVAELRRVADRRRSILRPRETQHAEAAQAPAISLRLASVDDERVVRRLAALDDARVPQGEVLLAEIDGDAVAALSLRDGHVVANPFVHTEAAVTLLRMRAAHVSGRRPRGRRPFILRARFA